MNRLLLFIILTCFLYCTGCRNVEYQKHTEYVDLGLPSGNLWATCNLGSCIPFKCGNYYAYGETSSKSSFTRDNYEAFHKDFYLNDTSIVLSADVAYLKSNHMMRIPSRRDYLELISLCDWVWTSNYKNTMVSGIIGTSRFNQNTIFFPAGGSADNDGADMCGYYGAYWTSTNIGKDSDCAYCFYFDENENRINKGWKFGGYLVRPIKK